MSHSLEIVSTLHMFCLQNPNWTKTCFEPNTFATRSYKSILCTFNSALRAEKERRWIKFSQCSINLNVLTLPTKLKLKQKLYHTFAPRLKTEMMIVNSLLQYLRCTLPQVGRLEMVTDSDWQSDWWGFWPIWFLLMVSICQWIVRISQNHIFITTRITIVKTKRKISKVLLVWLINMTPLHWTHFGKDCQTNIIIIIIDISCRIYDYFESLFMDEVHKYLSVVCLQWKLNTLEIMLCLDQWPL